MKPVAFHYYAPTTIGSAVSLLAQYVDDARLLAGGQTLLPMMNFRLVAPAVIIDLNRITELAYIKTAADVVRIGAMTRQRTIEFSPTVAEQLPLLRKAIQMVGHLPTRSRGTIGGSIANADSAAELPMILQVLEGEVEVRGAQGVRTIAAADLLRDAMTTSIAGNELLTEVRFPAMAFSTRHAIEEFSRRRGDFAIGAVAVTIVENDGVCTKARIATAGISAIATRLMEVEQCLEGHVVDEAAITEAARIAAHVVKPLEDRNASRAFRRHLTKALTERALRNALS
jgi:carbon-monoxide dehydrogenase medium subunit